MGILAPFAIAAVPLLAAIVALYLLKLRRPVAPVGSLHLWDSLTRDREANSLWQRLKISLLLLLQVLALTALILALARPWVTSTAASGQNAVIVLDVSASMGATDGGSRGQTRLAAAQDRAMSIVDNLPQGGSGALVEADTNASIAVPPTTDKARLRDGIRNAGVRASSTNLDEAMKLASVLVAGRRDTVIYVLSDGALPPVNFAGEPIQADVRFVPFGKGSDNAGISALSIQQHAGTLQLFVQVVNSAPVTVTRRLDLSVDEAPWTARALEIGPGAVQSTIVDDVPLQGRVIAAQIAEADSLESDNHAWVINRSSVPATVLLVTGGNQFLELALSLLPTVNLYKVSPRAYRPNEPVAGSVPDLTIFDADTGPDLYKALPQGNLLLLGPRQSSPLLSVQSVVSAPVLSLGGSVAENSISPGATSQDPLLKYVDLSGMHIAQSSVFEVPSWGRNVLSSDKGALVVAGETNGRKVAALGFDLHDTDLPLQTAFPMLVRNLVTYLLPDPSGGLPAAVAPGAVVALSPAAPEITSILVEDPSAKEWHYAVSAASPRVAFAETGQSGVYYVSQYAGEKLVGQEAFAANLFSRDESIITPNPALSLPLGNAISANEGEAKPVETFQREIWPVVAGLGLLLLLLEWLYAQRIAVRRALVEWQARRKAMRRVS